MYSSLHLLRSLANGFVKGRLEVLIKIKSPCCKPSSFAKGEGAGLLPLGFARQVRESSIRLARYFLAEKNSSYSFVFEIERADSSIFWYELFSSKMSDKQCFTPNLFPFGNV